MDSGHPSMTSDQQQPTRKRSLIRRRTLSRDDRPAPNLLSASEIDAGQQAESPTDYIIQMAIHRNSSDSSSAEIQLQQATSSPRTTRRRPSNVEEDVCFPLLPDIKTTSKNGIDHDALGAYLRGELIPASRSGNDPSDTTVEPEGDTLNEKDPLKGDLSKPIVPERRKQLESERFSFYSPATGVIYAETFNELTHEGKSIIDMLSTSGWWIDILSPTDAEMRAFSRIFRIHPLTTEDIQTEEAREKCEAFPNYMFVCIRTFDQDHYSPGYLDPISMYSVVMPDGILTVHHRPIPHAENVRARIEQLQNHITITPEWINYAIIDDITDSFAPLIQHIELEVDSIDELVLILKESEQSDMLRRIGHCRKKVMGLLKLLNPKVDVVRGLIKRCEDFDKEVSSSSTTIASGTRATMGSGPITSTGLASSGIPGPYGPIPSAAVPPLPGNNGSTAYGVYPTQSLSLGGNILHNDVNLFLGDIQDHLITMLQNLNHFEQILARSHYNYLAQISIELTQVSNRTNDVVGRLTVFATVLVPLNVITGLWGMNVPVPGMDSKGLVWFFWIVGFLCIFVLVAVAFAKRAGLC
ncbi:uncharacterized protein VTP21DRAFT_3951 [Calcarisporiella thermophila]|uniref:uncharacterized protein n=1 Tax=Calcarisporiella thermophila TaxID=911321 RepID=UPI003744867C